MTLDRDFLRFLLTLLIQKILLDQQDQVLQVEGREQDLRPEDPL